MCCGAWWEKEDSQKPRKRPYVKHLPPDDGGSTVTLFYTGDRTKWIHVEGASYKPSSAGMLKVYRKDLDALLALNTEDEMLILTPDTYGAWLEQQQA